jgi:hypothetical protein
MSDEQQAPKFLLEDGERVHDYAASLLAAPVPCPPTSPETLLEQARLAILHFELNEHSTKH